MTKVIVSVIIMLIAAALGFFIGIPLGNAASFMILMALIAGIACIIYAINSQKKY